MREELTFRFAERKDTPLILKFIRELADYEKTECVKKFYTFRGLSIHLFCIINVTGTFDLIG